jgi:hypothetical protein
LPDDDGGLALPRIIERLMRRSGRRGIIGEQCEFAAGTGQSDDMSEDLTTQGGSKANRVMHGQNTVRASVVPSHGRGAIMPAWRPGVSPNPGGRPAGYREARRALQDWASKQGVQRLIELAASPDDRVASVVVLGIFDRAYGKPKEFDPSEERKPVGINLSVLSTDEKRQMLEFLRRGPLTDAVPDAEPDTPEPIEGKAAEPGAP